MSSAVPIHPLVRLARRRLCVAPTLPSAAPRSKSFGTATKPRYAAARKNSRDSVSASARSLKANVSAAAPQATPSASSSVSPTSPSPLPAPSPPTSPPSQTSSAHTIAHSVDAAAPVRAYAASRRGEPSPFPSEATFKVADLRNRVQTSSIPTEQHKSAVTNDSTEKEAKQSTAMHESVAQKLPKKEDQSTRSTFAPKTAPEPSGNTPLTSIGEAAKLLADDACNDSNAITTEGVLLRPSDAPLEGTDATSSKLDLPPSGSYSSSPRMSGAGGRASDEASGTAGGGSLGSPPVTTEQAQDQGNGVPRQSLLYPFDTHAFIKRLQKAGFKMENSAALSHAIGSDDNGASLLSERPVTAEDMSLSVSKRHDPSEAIMEALHHMLVKRGQQVLDSHMNKTEVENQAYLFTAALAELRTELQVRARNDAAALRSMVTLLQREVDSLNQRMREDTAGMKHDIQVDMNNRKSEAKEEQNALEQQIQDLNNRFTISISEMKTSIDDGVRWDFTRQSLILVFGTIAIVIANLVLYDYFSRDDDKAGRSDIGKEGRPESGQAQGSSVRTKSAEELGLVAIEDDEHGNRYV